MQSIQMRSGDALAKGAKDAIPIGLGYLAVSFSLGIAARNAGMNAFSAFIMSILCNASAGEYAGINLIAARASLWEVALMTIIINARYLLMSCALSQRLHPDVKFRHRLGLSYDICDEIFAITIAQPGYLNPFYTYGAVLVAAPCWGIGTALGVIAGNALPANLVSAFSVALFGMFLAICVPAAKKDKVIRGIVVLCFAASYAASAFLTAIPEGTRTIVLTVAIAAGAALLFPRTQEEARHG